MNRSSSLPLLNGTDDGVLNDTEEFACSWCMPEGLSTPEYLMYNFIVMGLAMPFTGMLGLIGNMLSAFVYSRRSMRSSTNLYLCALAMSDILVIVTGLFLFSVDNLRRHSWRIEIFYGKMAPFFYPLGLTAQTCSVYFTVVAGIDCFFELLGTAGCRRKFCSVRMACFMISVVLLFSVLYNVPHIYELEVIECTSERWHGRSLAVCPSEFRLEPHYITIYYNYMYTIFMAGGPLVLLIILNGIIVIATAVQSRRRRRQHTKTATVHPPPESSVVQVNGSGEHESMSMQMNTATDTHTTAAAVQHTPPPTYAETVLVNTASAPMNTITALQQDIIVVDDSSAVVCPERQSVTTDDDPADTVTLILVVALFIFCNSLAFIINFLESSFSEQLGTVLNYLVDVSNYLVVCNSSANFIIYYAFGQHFRRTLRWYLCIRIRQPQTPPVMNTSSMVAPDTDGMSANGMGTGTAAGMGAGTGNAGNSGKKPTSNGMNATDVVSGQQQHRGYAPMKQARVRYTNTHDTCDMTERIYC